MGNISCIHNRACKRSVTDQKYTRLQYTVLTRVRSDGIGPTRFRRHRPENRPNPSQNPSEQLGHDKLLKLDVLYARVALVGKPGSS